MQTLPITPSLRIASAQCAVLRRHGFKRSDGCWAHGPLTFCNAGGWLGFSAPTLDKADPLGDLGAPGLWKSVRDHAEVLRVFAVREDWIRDEDLLTDEESGGFDGVVEWARASFECGLPNAWSLPERTRIDACLDKNRLTLVHRSFTRQLQIIYAPDRLALRLPILPTLPANLPDRALRWLRTLLLEAQSAHHLVRLGFAKEGLQTSVVAEVDLTAVPSMLLEPLLSTSCDALRWVVAWLIESADFLTQADVASRALEICAVPDTQPIGESKS